MEPFVSIVTPVYNGGKYIAECIESILAQTYSNWEYVVVDNCSTDRTVNIVQDYAQRESRIRLYNNETFLGMISNWNHALRQSVKDSKYCKVVHADDWLFPDCLTQMVQVAETHPSVGIVGGYRLHGAQVDLDGLPYPSTVVSGREICRAYMLYIAKLGGLAVFGAPTALLIRSDLIRKRDAFYNEDNLHADAEACCDVLKDTDFGFVHKVITYTRVHDESQTSIYEEEHTMLFGEFFNFLKFGPVYLSEKEYKVYLKNIIKIYYRALSISFFQKIGKKRRQYHYKHLSEIGCPLSTLKLAMYVGLELGDMLLSPKDTLQRIVRKFRRQ